MDSIAGKVQPAGQEYSVSVDGPLIAIAGNAGIERDLPPGEPDDGQSQRLAAREGRFDDLLVGVHWGSMGVSEPLPAAETRLGRRTALTFPLLPPPQKN